MLSRLIKNKLKLKPSRCYFFQKKILYLGFIVDESGLRPDPDRIAAIKCASQPKTVTEIRSFVGLCSYHRRHVKNLSKNC